MVNKNFILAVACLVGTIIGAGIFGIPYLIARSGLGCSLFYFLILGATVIILHLLFGETILRTKENYRLIGYTAKYLGPRAKLFITFSTLIGTIGALLAYIILGGTFLNVFLPFSSSLFQSTIIFWLLFSSLLLLRIKSLAWIQLIMDIGFLGVIILIFSNALPLINFDNFISVSRENILLPYGVIMFSLIGLNAVPEVAHILKKKRDLKQVIIVSLLISVCVYIFFGISVVGVSGLETSPEAFQGLVAYLGEKIIVIGSLLGMLAVSTSFLILGNYLKNSLILDYKIGFYPAFLITVFSPLVLYIIGIRQFISVIAFIGVFVGFLEGLIIIKNYLKSLKQGNRQPGYSLKITKPVLCFIIVVLSFGVFSQIVYYLKDLGYLAL